MRCTGSLISSWINRFRKSARRGIPRTDGGRRFAQHPRHPYRRSLRESRRSRPIGGRRWCKRAEIPSTPITCQRQPRGFHGSFRSLPRTRHSSFGRSLPHGLNELALIMFHNLRHRHCNVVWSLRVLLNRL